MSERDPNEIVLEMQRRDVHVRQYPHRRGDNFEIWADGERKAWASTPLEAESRLRVVVGISNAEGHAVEALLERERGVS